jgi:hypothetical protein
MSIEIHPPYEQRERPGLISLSATGHCPTKISKEYLGHPHTNFFPPRTRRTLALGHAIESLVIQWLNDRGHEVVSFSESTGKQLEVGEGSHIGHLDLLVGLDGAELKPGDVKSIQDGWTTKLVKGGELLVGFKGWCKALGVSPRSFDDVLFIGAENHNYANGFYGVREVNFDYYAQAQMYMHYGRLLELEQVVNWDRFLFIVFDKNDSKILIEEIAYDPEFVSTMLKKLHDIEETAMAGKVVTKPVEMEPNVFPCGTKAGVPLCSYFNDCWGAKS